MSITKRHPILLTITAIIAPIVLSRAADVTGVWQSEFDSRVGHLKYTFNFKTEGEKLTGTATRELEGKPVTSDLQEGRLADGQITFVELLKFNDQDVRIEYRGKLAGDEISFTRKVGEFATMEIVAHRASASAGQTANANAKTVALKVIKVDSEETVGENGRGTNAVDGNPSTLWHTEWETEGLPGSHEITIELNPPARIKGFTYLPRQDGQENGMIKRYEFYVSTDGKDFGMSVAKGEFPRGKALKTVTFEPRACRFVRLRARSEVNGQPWASAAEIGVIPE